MLIALTAVTCSMERADHPDTAPDLPTHSECLPEGEQMSEETCLAVVKHDNRLPTVSYYMANVEAPDPDPRIDDVDYLWLAEQAQRCTCSCCHTSSLGGPGIFRWDLEFEPMWIDSATDWTLKVFAGFTYSEDQVLPIEDQDRLQRIVQAELDRRDLADQNEE